MAFLDTLSSLQTSLSPLNRASPTGSGDIQPLDANGLFQKIETLRSCVQQLPAFSQAFSDDGRLTANLSNMSASSRHTDNIHDPPSANTKSIGEHGTNGNNKTYSFFSQPTTSFQPLPPTAARSHTEHGNIRNLAHHNHYQKDTVIKPGVHSMPGMFASNSHGSVFHAFNNHYNEHNAHNGQHHYPYHGGVPS
eukprot:381889_1